MHTNDTPKTPETAAAGSVPSLLVTVENMAYGGKGVARDGGKVYFVADAIPGDVARVAITSDSGRYAEAQILELVTPSPLRTPPPCAFATACGGCQWMGIDYKVQTAWKLSFVESALQRIGKISADTTIEILPSPEVYGYRNRILVRAHLSSEGLLLAGYFQRASRELVPITGCSIAAPAVNAALKAIMAIPWAELNLPPLKLRLELQEVHPVDGKNILVTIYPGEGQGAAMETFAAAVKKLPTVLWGGLVFALDKAPSVLFDHDQELSFLTIPGQFQQVNVAHNHTLRRLVKDKVDAVMPQRILDVFCGSGNLSLPLADGQRYIEGIESNRHAIGVARRNAEANLLANVHYLTGDAERHLWKCDRGGEKFDLVILDPPRQGMYKGMVPLKNLAPANIIYVSCDPTTLARDLGYLCRGDFYKLTQITALDFFPNTYHVETVAFLSRSR